MRNVSTVNASYRADYEIDIPGPDQAALIAGTGAGQSIKFIYQPEAGDKSSKIVFIQVAQALLDKVPVKPSKISLAWQYLDADTTPEFWWVDSRLGEKDPYYKGDDKGLDIGVQGNAIPPNKRDAITDDKPIKNDVFPPCPPR